MRAIILKIKLFLGALLTANSDLTYRHRKSEIKGEKINRKNSNFDKTTFRKGNSLKNQKKTYFALGKNCYTITANMTHCINENDKKLLAISGNIICCTTY